MDSVETRPPAQWPELRNYGPSGALLEFNCGFAQYILRAGKITADDFKTHLRQLKANMENHIAKNSFYPVDAAVDVAVSFVELIWRKSQRGQRR